MAPPPRRRFQIAHGRPETKRTGTLGRTDEDKSRAREAGEGAKQQVCQGLALDMRGWLSKQGLTKTKLSWMRAYPDCTELLLLLLR